MAEAVWQPLPCDYAALAEQSTITGRITNAHPLSEHYLDAAADGIAALVADRDSNNRGAGAANTAVTTAVSSQQDGEVDLDPLSAMAMLDPLSAMASGAGAGAGATSKSAFTFGAKDRKRDPARGRAESTARVDARQVESDRRRGVWEDYKAGVLRAHNVAGKIRVTASFLSDVSNQDEQTPVAMDRARARLEALEKTEEDSSVEMSDKEILSSVEKHRRDLVGAWTRAERVRSLKISIQVAKLLLETSVPQFYPLLFVHVTDILDTFGDLVFKRIFKRAQQAQAKIDSSKRITSSFTSADISSDAKETCRNWIYKTACIRELLPRLYVEMSLLRCYRFLSDDEFPAIVARLYNCIRGIGDVMVAAYARAYLARCASEVLDQAQARERIIVGLQDYLYTFKELSTELRQNQLRLRGLTLASYNALMSDALEWQIRTVAQDATKEVFTTLLAKYRELCNDTMVLKHILGNFSAKLYAQHARSMVALINEATETCTPRAECFQALAAALTEYPPPEEQRLPLLNDAWRVVTRTEDAAVYTECVASFMGMLLKHYSERELVILLTDCANKMSAAAAAAAEEQVADEADAQGDRPRTLPAAAEPGVNRIINMLLGESGHSVDFGTIFTSDAFVQLLDLFKPDQKAAVSKRLLEFFTKTQAPTNDPVVIHMLFDVARTLHDSLDSLSVEDERRQIAKLICRFIDKIDFGRDLEQQLNTLVDCRAVFANLDSVKDRLVLAASQLAMRALKYMKGRHSRKTAAFVKACFAYCHITIPSIDNIFSRLDLFLLCGQAALINNCLPQADTFYKAAIQDIVEMGDSVSGPQAERRLVTFLRNFISAMVVVPGHPDHGPFYLAKGLKNAVERFPWASGSAAQTEVYIAMIPLLSAYGQRALPYHVRGVESNDLLYAGDPTYTAELQQLTAEIVNAILAQLSAIVSAGGTNGKKLQTNLIVNLINELITSFTLDESNLKLVLNLFRLASKNDAAHAGLAAAVALVKSRAATAANDPRAIPGRPSRWESLVPLASALSRKRVGAR